MQESPPVLYGIAPAKINLFFEVLGKRQDGYHDVCSICVPVNLFDTLFFLPNSQGTVCFSVENGLPDRRRPDIMNDGGDVPDDRNNLVVKALEAVRKIRHVTQGVDVVLLKRIPSCAGLGGGSSDAATAIMMADRIWNLKLSQADYTQLGAELGSDVPLFFTPGYSLGEHRGEVVRPVESSLRLDVVIVKPPFGIRTKDAFDRLDRENRPDRPADPGHMVCAIESRNPFLVGVNLMNRLESAAKAIHPDMESILAFLARQDCLGVSMSGSGTACYGICRNRNHAKHVASRMKNLDLGTVFLTHTLSGMNRCFRSQKRVPIADLD